MFFLFRRSGPYFELSLVKNRKLLFSVSIRINQSNRSLNLVMWDPNSNNHCLVTDWHQLTARQNGNQSISRLSRTVQLTFSIDTKMCNQTRRNESGSLRTHCLCAHHNSGGKYTDADAWRLDTLLDAKRFWLLCSMYMAQSENVSSTTQNMRQCVSPWTEKRVEVMREMEGEGQREGRKRRRSVRPYWFTAASVFDLQSYYIRAK